ncbi:MAG: hypothetical protein ALECFALPRED_006371 [Alectoria fallacina]|uniref:Major facilitator superfamily (MFS) profile domain-containing protein n=1 Tax=Alectoria fallacina TaxID=1903189 RepID=A0A8H3G6B3_9LECA|nr:MAG: hypothetical protein ALECFALPRED_006371 [Alectoria fallacina]
MSTELTDSFGKPGQRNQSDDSAEVPLKTSSTGFTLIPQPSDDVKDPLNWSLLKKFNTLFIWCLGSFVTTASGLGNALGYFVQAKVYNKPDPISLSYSVVAATAGIAIGPLFAVPLARQYGRTCIFFWSLVGLLVTGIWSASMTRSNQYGAFVVARLFGGLFGGTAPALGADTIVDMFFLHQRGKAFTALNLSFLAGVVVGPTLSGFIVGSTNWTVQFWWSNGLEGLIIILTLVLLEDTYYDRTSGGDECRSRWPESFIANRVATFFGGADVIPAISMADTLQIFCKSILIGICPVTLLCGGLVLVDFGFAAFFNIILTVFLQNPVTMRGYGFTPAQNAEFLFCLWFGVIAAQLYGHFANDRIPVWICYRNGGIWEPEYRLHTLWLPGLVILPVALGLYGASLQYHLHYMVLALACFLGGFATNAIVPVTVTYVIECFKGHASETAAIMGVSGDKTVVVQELIG